MVRNILFGLLVMIALIGCNNDDETYHTIVEEVPDGYTYIPDANFELALMKDRLDDKLDGKVLTNNIKGVWDLWISNSNIKDLTGIEDFTSLNYLYCIENQLTSLDLSNNKELLAVYCWSNQLTSVDVSNNKELRNLRLDRNQLTFLDVSKNILLEELWVGKNQLKSLDVSKNTELYFLECGENQLTRLNGIQNTLLEGLICSNNLLTSLDVSNNTGLTWLVCYNNRLSSLKANNGKTPFPFTLNANNNPELFCIEVYEAIAPNFTSLWPDGHDTHDAHDPQFTWSENCDY